MPTTVATILAAAMSWTPRRRSMQQQHLFMDMLVDLGRREKFTTFASPSRHLGKTLTNGQGFRSGERKKIDTRPLRVSQHVLATDSEIVSGGKAKPWRHAPTTYVSGSIKKIKTLARRKQYTECEKFRKETNGPNS